MNTCLIRSALLAVLIVLPPALRAATITVSPERAGPAVPRAVLGGFNYGNWMPVAEQREALAAVPAGALRFPAGNAGDDADLDAASLGAFAAVLPLVPGRPGLMVQTRVYQGRDGRPAANGPEDAASAVRLAREHGLDVTYWEIGNEPDLYGPVRGDATWTAERYCAVARAQAAAVRREQPSALIAGPAVSGAVPSAQHFLEAFVERCGDVIDVLTWHLYPTEGNGTDEAALATVADVDASVARYRALWTDPKRNPLGHTRPVRLGVTEYGLSWRTDRPRFLSDQVGAMWAMESALRLARGGVEVAHYFAYTTTGFHGLLDVGGAPRPTYYAFRLLGGLSGRFVEAVSDDPSLWAHAVRDGDDVSVVLLNTRTRAASVKLDAGALKVQDARWFDARIADAEAPLDTLPARRQLTLPPRSVTLVRLCR